MNPASQLRLLPAIDEVLLQPALQPLLESSSREQVTQWAREAVGALRKQILGGAGLEPDDLMPHVVEQVLQQKSSDEGQRLQPVLNATGILLHTNLGRAPLAKEAVEHMATVAQNTNIEMDLGSGKRSKRGERVRRLLAKLTGADDALVVNNCAAATILVLQGIAAGKEVVVSRGQLVEIGGGFRLPDVFEAAGVRLREVGTTNRTYLRDYEAVVNEETGALIRVHRSNFHQSGFVCEPPVEELVLARRPESVPVIDDLGSGHVVDLAGRDLPAIIQDEPRVQDSVRAGADLSLFSGDKLFGGPQSGIVVGKQAWISKLAKHPMMRALRPDKLTLAALESTAEIHLAGQSCQRIPLFQMLCMAKEDVRNRCDHLLASLSNGLKPEIQLEVVECHSQIGGGSMPGSELESCSLAVASTQTEVGELAARLRQATVAVHGRVHDGKLLLDLRTILESQLPQLTQSLREVFCES
ncbi:MAG: L-seryl-tRNA(Sec) selenium transferase [Planctomycetota bacterium]